MNYSIIRGTF